MMTQWEARDYIPQWGSYMTASDPGAIAYGAIPPDDAESRDAMVDYLTQCQTLASHNGAPDESDGDDDFEQLKRAIAYLESIDYDAQHWSDGSGRLNLTMTLQEAESASHSAGCESSVRALLALPHIAEQVDAWNESYLRDNLSEYGAWDDDELSDDEMNRVRTLWLACGDIVEESKQ